MDIKILKDDKKELDVEINNLTMAELLRVYLNQEDVKLAAWKRDHPTKNPVLHIEADNPKKLLVKAIDTIQKELNKAQEDFKKSK